MKIDMSNEQHLWVQLNPMTDRSEVIVDKDAGDIRICDSHTIIKVIFNRASHLIESILVDDIFVWRK